MNDKKFWKIIYLYITKYGYNILYYRPEKKDVWLINDDNELLRLIYSESFKSTEIDSVVSNIIRNEVRLKKMFKLNSLKIKILCFSPEFDEIIADYKKYRISAGLAIERVLYNEKNKTLFIKERDLRFIDATPDTLRYKNKVVELYKNQTLNRSLFDYKFNIISLIYIFFYIFNYLIVYTTNREYSLFQFLEYNYQKIISGQFYRAFTDVFIEENIKSLAIILLTILASSILFNKSLHLLKSLGILVTISFVFNLFLVFGYGETLDIALLANFGLLGAIFLEQLSKKNDNLKFMYISALSLIYLIMGVIFTDTAIVLYIFSFVIGLFLQLFLTKKRNLPILASLVVLTAAGGEVILAVGSPTKNIINDYRLKKVDENLLQKNSDEDIFNLEKELSSKNKSILTYYELGMIKMINSSKQDAKKVFLEGVSFDDSFAPIYYNLGLIERQEGNYSKSKEYAQKAYDLEKNDKYKNLLDELAEY